MTKPLPKYPRILGIALSSRGFGFALLEGLDTLADWGVKTTTGDKNKGTVLKVDEFITHYQPDVVVLENNLVKPFHRSVKIRTLTRRIVNLAKRRKVSVRLFSREQVKRRFLSDERGTKHALAEMLTEKFSEELGFRLPPKRKPWMSEDYRMNIFGAVALALMIRGTSRQS